MRRGPSTISTRGTDWAAGHTRRFVDRDALTKIFPLNEFVDCLEKRWTIIGVGFDCLRAQLERDLLGRTLAFRTDVDIRV